MGCDYQIQNSSVDIFLSSLSSGCPTAPFMATWSLFCGSTGGPGNCGPIRVELDLNFSVGTGWSNYAHQCVDVGSVTCGNVASRSVTNGNPYCWAPAPPMGGFPNGSYQLKASVYTAACNNSGNLILFDTSNIARRGGVWESA